MTDVSPTLTRFRGELEGAVARDLRRRRRRARVARPIAGALTLAAVGGVLAATLVGSSGPSIVERAEAALAAPSGRLLHMVMVGRSTAADGRAPDTSASASARKARTVARSSSLLRVRRDASVR